MSELNFITIGIDLGGTATRVGIFDSSMRILDSRTMFTRVTGGPLFADSMFKSVHDHSLVYRLMAPTQTLTIEQGRTFIRQALLGPSAGLPGAALLPHLHRLGVPSTPLACSAQLVPN